MRRGFPWLVVGGMVFLLWQSGANGESEFGEIVYPAFGNLRGEEGTIIVEFRIDEPIPAEPEAWYQPKENTYIRFSIVQVKISEDNNLKIFYRVQGDRGALWTMMHLRAFPPNSPN